MFVGVPGSGKSTYLNRLKNRLENALNPEGWLDTSNNPDFVVISTDNLIEEKAKALNATYDIVFKTYMDDANKKAIILAKQAINLNKTIFWDQTNLTIKSRKNKLKLFPEKYYKVAIVIETPDENVLFDRLNKRSIEEGKTIPESIVRNMINSYQEPTVDEGFHEVRSLRNII